MFTTAQIVNPKGVEVEITIRMTIKDWNELVVQLGNKWPGSELAHQIIDANQKIHKVVYASEKKET